MSSTKRFVGNPSHLIRGTILCLMVSYTNFLNVTSCVPDLRSTGFIDQQSFNVRGETMRVIVSRLGSSLFVVDGMKKKTVRGMSPDP